MLVRFKRRDFSRDSAGACATSSSGYEKLKWLLSSFKQLISPAQQWCSSEFARNPREFFIKFIPGLFLLILGSYGHDAFSNCPAQFDYSSLRLPAVKRSNLRLFTFDKGEWQELPLQVDPLDSGGQMTFPLTNFMSEVTNSNDRISVPGSEFAKERFSKDLNEKTAPCAAIYGRELKSSSGFGWLFQCAGANPRESPVAFDKDKALVESEGYRYHFDPSNHILFKKVEIKQNGNWLTVAEDSSVNIRSDIKNFFTIDFEPSDITSRLEEVRMGPMGLVGRVRFYLNVLFFKIKLSLVTEVSFFKNSAHVPMIMYSPVEASKYLHPLSGIYYYWKSPLEMKKIAVSDRLMKSEYIDEWLSTNCNQIICRHALIAPNLFKMEFQIPKKLEQKSFLPVWALANKQTKLNIPAIPKKAEGQGLYFETSELSKGGHQWDFWMGLGATEESQCPSDVSFERGYLK